MIEILPIIISFIALFVSWLTYINGSKNLENNFRDMLSKNIKSVKYTIINMEKSQYDTLSKKILLMEIVNDKLYYMQKETEKKKYLTSIEYKNLFDLQLDIEDCIGCIMLDTDIETNKNIAINNINNCIKSF